MTKSFFLYLYKSIILTVIFSFSSFADPFTYGGHTYELVKKNIPWDQAQTASRNLSINGHQGYLAHISSEAENQAIYNHLDAELTDAEHALITHNYNGGVPGIWIGANDKNQEGNWQWEDDHSQFWQGRFDGGHWVNGSYNNWGTRPDNRMREPDDSDGGQCGGKGQDAAIMALAGWPAGRPVNQRFGHPGQWNDVCEDLTHYFVVEIDATNGNNKAQNNDTQNVPVFGPLGLLASLAGLLWFAHRFGHRKQ